jgi:glucokinase
MREWSVPAAHEAGAFVVRASGPVLALDFGRTWIRAAAVLPDGAIIGRHRRRTPVEDGAAAIVEASVAALRAVRDELGPERRAELVGIGISATGPVDPWQGIILDPPNFTPDFHDVPFALEVEREFALPTYLDRDTNVAALAELSYGAGRLVRDFVYLTVSSGVGGAIVHEGRLFWGPDGTAGEFGHIMIELDGPPCGCGDRGHLEAIASGLAIAHAAQAAALEGGAPILAEIADRIAPALLEAHHVAEAEDRGDPVAAWILERARHAFAAAAVGITNTLNPRRIVVGGSVARAQGERWLAPARDAVRRFAFRVPGSRVEIVPAELGDDVGLVGAVPLVGFRIHGASAERASPAVASVGVTGA